jgi:hypothetical protein
VIGAPRASHRPFAGRIQEDTMTTRFPTTRCSRSPRPAPTFAAILLLLAGFGLHPAAARAQNPSAESAARTELELTADSVRLARKEIVARAMALSTDQANKFWPIYDEYQKSISTDNSKLFEAVSKFAGNFANMTDDQAKTALKEFQAREERVLDTRRKYMGRFGKVLSPKEVLRLYQLESKMDAVLRFALAGAVPLVEPSPTH